MEQEYCASPDDPNAPALSKVCGAVGELNRIEGTIVARRVRDWLIQWELMNPEGAVVVHAANGVELTSTDIRKLIGCWETIDPVNMTM